MEMKAERNSLPQDMRDNAADTETCEVFIYNPEAVARLRRDLADVSAIAALFNLLGDPSRCKMVLALSKSRELCVCDLSEIVGLSLPTVSHHLRKLREQGLVSSRREGKLVFYRLDDEATRTLLELAEAREAVTP